MKAVHANQSLPSLMSSVVSVGNFDGVHKGHRELIEMVVKRARELKVTAVIVTFDPHTRAVLNPDTPQPVLTTCAEKEVLMRELGVDVLACIPFTRELATMEPNLFIDKLLIGRFKAIEWVMGENHAFGQNRRGSKNFLHEDTGRKHFTIFAIALSSQQNSVISSTRIRSRIVEGKIQEAVAMLGHPYLIMAERIRGTQTGTTLGFPTLNFKLPPSHKVIPPPGVYAAELKAGSETWTGALYIGDCPTFTDRDYHMEFHVLSGNGPHPKPGETAALWVHSFVRRDKMFDTTNELVEQIQRDITQIQEFFIKE